jgi:2-hydroxychromene-2-carboxylate isomerase
MSVPEPIFYYDVSSPYAYLAACRVDDVFPVRPRWRPIAFGVIVRRLGKVPWSFGEHREEHFAAIARRASERGLPEIRYPQGWPVEMYSLAPLRAMLLATDQDQLRCISRELFCAMFVDGRHLADIETVLDAAERAGMDRATVREGIERPDVKQRLRAATDEAIAHGDDRLEEAAAALA